MQRRHESTGSPPQGRASPLPWPLLYVCLLVLAAIAFGRADAAPRAEPLVLDAPVRVNLAPHVDVLEDRSGRLTLDDVRAPGLAARFVPAPADTDINFGYTRSAWWLRFTLQAREESERLLEVAFPSLDDVQFFAPTTGGGWQRTAVGDRRGFEQRPIAHRHFVFPLELDANLQATYYLRVASEGTMTVPLALWPEEAFHAHDRGAYSALALYFGMLIALALYNLLLYLSLREPGYLAYVAFALSMAIGQASLSGVGNQFLWPQWIAWGDMALPVGFALTGLFGAMFTRIFLATARIVPWIDRLIVTQMVLFAFAAVLPLVAPYRYAAILTSLIGATFSVTAVVAGAVCLRRGQAGARYYLIAWSMLMVGVLVLALRNIGLLPTNVFTIHAMLVGSALEMLLLSFALAHRITTLTGDRQKLLDDALAAALQAEQELEAKVAWRTRELALANAELESTLATLERAAATDRLTGAWNRRWFERAAHAEIERVHRHGDEVSLVVIDIDRFKQINDRLGHAAGDKVLVAVADAIGENIRGSDSLTRWGGEEFLVLAPATALAGAVRLAEKLRQQVARTYIPAVGAVTISCGVTQFRAGQRLEDFIAAADAAMYRAKEKGRNCVEVTTMAEEQPAAVRSA